MRYSARKIAMMTAVAAVLGAQTAAQATVFSWNVGNGNFGNAGNWTPAGGPPVGADTAQFNLATTYTVTFQTNPTNTQLTVGGSNNVTFITDGNSRTYTLSGGATISGGTL